MIQKVAEMKIFTIFVFRVLYQGRVISLDMGGTGQKQLLSK